MCCFITLRLSLILLVRGIIAESNVGMREEASGEQGGDVEIIHVRRPVDKEGVFRRIRRTGRTSPAIQDKGSKIIRSKTEMFSSLW